MREEKSAYADDTLIQKVEHGKKLELKMVGKQRSLQAMNTQRDGVDLHEVILCVVGDN